MKRQIGTVNLAKQATNMGVNLCKYFQPHCALLGGGGVKIGCCCTLTRNRPFKNFSATFASNCRLIEW